MSPGWCLLIVAWFHLSIVAAQGPSYGYGPKDQQVPGKAVRIVLKTGGQLTAPVLDHDPFAVVVTAQQTPFVFSWNEIEMPSAYGLYRQALVEAEGKLGAEDYLAIGDFCLERGRIDLANREFAAARRQDPALAPLIAERIKTFRAARREAERLRRARSSDQGGDALRDVETEGNQKRRHDPESEDPNSGDENARDEDGRDENTRDPNKASLRGLEGMSVLAPDVFGTTPDARLDEAGRRRVTTLYREFGESAREHVYEKLELLETEHFLIFTDWPRLNRPRLATWCESMFSALADRFGVSREEPLFLAKCPVFAWSVTSRFQQFARKYDGFDGRHSLGYTRSIEASGHVHMSLLLQGNQPDDFDRFAGTLVHEGTHAFIHRLESTRLIPHWVNEGLAELVAEEVLGDRYDAAEKADLLAKQFVKFDWPIIPLLERDGPIAVHEYPLAHSVIRFLETRRRGGLADLVRHLKAGQSTTAALETAFPGITLEALDTEWRAWVRARTPSLRDDALPWKSPKPE